MFARGTLAGTEIARVIGVHAIGKMCETKLGAQGFHPGKELGLAVEAAVAVVPLIFGLVELFRLKDAQRHGKQLGEGTSLIEIAACQAGRVSQHGEHFVAQNTVRSGGEKSRVHSTGVSDHYAAQGAQPVFECLQLCCRRCAGLGDCRHRPDYNGFCACPAQGASGCKSECVILRSQSRIFRGTCMKMQRMTKWAGATALALAFVAAPLQTMAQSDTVLKPADVQKLLPSAVYYKAQFAPTQLRNSGGVKFSDGYYVLATLVDTSGYSSDVAAKYQVYFIAEIPIKIGSENLPAGVYGVGFIGGGKFVVTDVGAHDVFTVSTSTDEEMKRPVPLQVQADPVGDYRLYAGRRYVTFTR